MCDLDLEAWVGVLLISLWTCIYRCIKYKPNPPYGLENMNS